MCIRDSSIIYDDDKEKATGVRVIDSETLEMTEYYAKIIFLNASTVNSTLIMLNSKSNRFQNGFGNDCGELGHNMMDHHFKADLIPELQGRFPIRVELDNLTQEDFLKILSSLRVVT